MAGLNPQITNIVIVLGMVQVAKLIPFENPDVLNIVRATYVCSNLIIVGVYLWMQSQMDKKKGHDHAQVRRAGAARVLRGGQARDDDGARLRQGPAEEPHAVAAYGRGHDGLHAPVPQVHQPAADPVHHPAQGPVRGQPDQDLPVRPTHHRRPQEALQGRRWIHERPAERAGPERQEGRRGGRAGRPRRRQGGVGRGTREILETRRRRRYLFCEIWISLVGWRSRPVGRPNSVAGSVAGLPG